MLIINWYNNAMSCDYIEGYAVSLALVPEVVRDREALNAQNANNTLYRQYIIDIMSNKCLLIPHCFRQ
jgi:hypothetical protein